MKITELKKLREGSGLTRLAKEDDEKIMDEVYRLVEIEPTMSPAEKKIRKERAKRLDDFIDRFALAPSRQYMEHRPDSPEIIIHRLYWENLPELMEICGISYKRLFEIVMSPSPDEPVELTWSNETLENLAHICDSLPEKSRNNLLAFMEAITPDRFKETGDNKTPLKRFCDYQQFIQRRKGDIYYRMEEKDWSKVYRGRNFKKTGNLISHSQMPAIAKEFNLTVHWLLGLDASTCILADHGETEMIVDYFSLIDSKYQDLVWNALKKSVWFER